MLELAASLANPSGRAAAAQALASELGADNLVIFLRDPEVGALLSAPGFEQTFPGGRLWQAFLGECISRGCHEGALPVRRDAPPVPVTGYASGQDTVLVLVGPLVPAADITWFLTLMPLIASALRGEQTAALASVQARLSREAASRAALVTSALDRTRHQLEAHAATLQATNAALEEARSIADTANLAKSEFLATMSHELRTPLNAIGGYAELLAMGIHGPVNEEQAIALARINRSQRHLLGLINNILNLSRIAAGRVDYAIADVSLRDAIADIGPMIEPQLVAKGVSYEVRNVDALPVVRADREKLQQILLNLLSNSVKFTDLGGKVWLEGEMSEEDPGRVEVRVSDTGRGIPDDKLETIFEPFTQVDASHSRPGEGTGLGLAISRDLARGMGGDMRARSTLGQGSTFVLTLNSAFN